MFLSEARRDPTITAARMSLVLQWTPDSMRGRTAPALFNADAGNLDRPSASLDRALQEQLGLRLESRKGPVDVLVVDHAEKVPADN